MILTAIGEVGVCVDGDTHVLRPSLYAMSRLGPPAYIVEAYATVMAEGLGRAAAATQFGYAYEIMSCCTEDDITHLIGAYEPSESGSLVYKPGMIPVAEMMILARCLITHGVTGSVEPEEPSRDDDDRVESDYVAEFDTRKHVATAIAHLGMSEKEAWNTTMTALVDALRAKFPRPKDAEKDRSKQAPTKDEYEATMEWADKIEAKRRLQLGIGE